MRSHCGIGALCSSGKEASNSPALRSRHSIITRDLTAHLDEVRKHLNISLPTCSLSIGVEKSAILDDPLPSPSESLKDTLTLDTDDIFDDDLIANINNNRSGKTTARALGNGGRTNEDCGKGIEKNTKGQARKRMLRVLDNLLLLTSEHIDSSHSELYSIFPCLTGTIVQLCDDSSSWSWAEIYFYSIIRLVDTSSISRLKKKGGPSDRTSFLISLACYLATQMCQFDPVLEPALGSIFVHGVIPTLVDLTQQQLDVCDTPGVTLMYIFLRISVPLKQLVYEAQFSIHPKINEELFMSGATEFEIPNRGLRIYHPTTTIKRIPSLDKNEGKEYSTTHAYLHEKIEQESYILKFLKVFWIKCAVLGYQRRNRPYEEKMLFDSLEAAPEVDFDQDFWNTYCRLLHHSFKTENDLTIRALYANVFKLSPPQ